MDSCKISRNSGLISDKSFFRRAISRKIVLLIAKLALALLLIPLAFPSYYKWVARSFSRTRKTPIPNVEPAANGAMPLKKISIPNVKSAVKQMQERYERVGDKKGFFGRVNFVPRNFGLWMPGVALVADHLAKKHKVANLFTCETLEDFQKKLNEFLNRPGVFKGAFILPTFNAGMQGLAEGIKPNFPQHKLTVAVEKSEERLFIAILDAMPRLIEWIDGSHLACDSIFENWEKVDAFKSQELALRAIFKCLLPLKTRVFYSVVKREVSYGCEVFALRDAITFLKDDAFFKKIEHPKEPSSYYLNFPLYPIESLPAAYMVGTQSMAKLSSFMKEKKEREFSVIPLKQCSLSDYIQKYVVEVEREEQNHYITHKMVKYMELALKSLEARRLRLEQAEPV